MEMAVIFNNTTFWEYLGIAQEFAAILIDILLYLHIFIRQILSLSS